MNDEDQGQQWLAVKALVFLLLFAVCVRVARWLVGG